MKKLIKKLILLSKLILFLPMLGLYCMSSVKLTITKDVERWRDVFKWSGSKIPILFRLLAEHREFRNLYYFRLLKDNIAIRIFSLFLKFFYRESSFLMIETTTEIAPGLFIQHGLATVINAETIGENCWINQQVTVGYKDEFTDRPIIGRNVQICAGAKVIGEIKVGDNVKIGANAVVVKDVPDNCTVVGVPARIVRREGRRCELPNNE